MTANPFRARNLEVAGAGSFGNTTANSYSNSSGVWSSNSTAHMFLRPDGIGSANSGQNLNLYGNNSVLAYLSPDGILTVGNSTINTAITSTSINIYNSSAYFRAGNSSVASWLNSTAFGVGGNVATIGTALYAVANGNIGIQSNSPMADLFVNGNYVVKYQYTGTASSHTIDLSSGNFFYSVCSGSTTLTFTNPPPSHAFGFSILTYGAAGGTLTWGGSGTKRWPNGSAPAGSSYYDLWSFMTYDGGANYWGNLVRKNMY